MEAGFCTLTCLILATLLPYDVWEELHCIIVCYLMQRNPTLLMASPNPPHARKGMLTLCGCYWKQESAI